MKIIIAVIVLLISSTFLITQSFAQNIVLPNGFGTIVTDNGGRYYAQDVTNVILSSSDTPDIVIKTALGRGGDIYIGGGTYNLSKDFAGFDLKSHTHLKLAQDARIVVPSGYGGYVFRFNTLTIQSVLEGGQIYEADPVKRNWIAILMQGTGVSFNYISNMVVTNPYIVIDFSTITPGYISANTFDNINANNFVRGIEFDFIGKYKHGASGFLGNTFRDLQFQSGSMTTYGAKDIEHIFNAFYNVEFWDLPANAISATVDPLAEHTIIIGGQMTYRNFVDAGANTIVLDSWHNSFSSNSTILSEIIKGTYQPKVNIPTISANQALNMSMPQQLTTGFVKGNHGQFAISQEHPIDINIYGTVNNPKGGSVILYITKPDGVVEQNEAYITSTGTFYYPLVFDKDSLTGQYKIGGLYQNSNLGSLFINVTSTQTLPSETNSQPNIAIVPTLGSNTTLSTTIKINAKLWSLGQINDDVFGNSIQNLAKAGIIKNMNGNQTSLHQSLHIPTWFKNNAGWWTDGQISDTDFISELQYLLDGGIIQIPS